MVRQLDAPRVVWVMVPHGADRPATPSPSSPTCSSKGDLVIDGGNSKFTDDFENEKLLKAKGIGYLDCGVSGGIWGLENGYGLMVGGTAANVKKAMPIFDALRPEGPRDEGFVHAGKVGAGHYTKMVHNGIEYGLMHAYAEGYELLEEGHRRGRAGGLQGVEPRHRRAVLAARPHGRGAREEPHPGGRLGLHRRLRRGRWTVEEAIALDVPMPVISASLFARFASRQQVSPTMQAVAALRGEFGGHQVMTIAEGEALRVGRPSRPVPPRRRRQRSAAKKARAPRRSGRCQEGRRRPLRPAPVVRCGTHAKACRHRKS
jgi:6-phosphogluconate dehydrogenase